ncbi:uncharacterized protein F5Z01DRAFT_634234 [Emericellopsis atlantica]|uniref:CID domain-containing protein n=1 Tax=Emericellopsis atlantica TaxID=2614577 RepID=A0A9P7ZQW4_9HYPO|nr:uncharacterized protein F5Z01DRAFT_634234 [Emericellopsis atlantica]KAG9256659.1 hypothetical protein F5Z01DRAFT_634234 [Emericellopsis atlantica]
MPTEAEEVAEDYRLALEDLSTNARFEISNLTVIARENTEHALAIAQTLEQHILKTAPNKKLPALYVLDSIVKNVGTPYTLYLGRNLFKTFMESYTVVDNPTRRRLEEMLKTWTQPVAGSLDTRPVFSPDLVRPIENALMKAKAAMMPQTQLPGRPRSAMPPFRNTPTPPGARNGGTPTQHHQAPQQFPYGVPPTGQAHHYGQPNAYPQQNAQVYPYQQGMPYGQNGTHMPPTQAGVDVEALSKNIADLIAATRLEAAQKPYDGGVTARLNALLDLQRIIQSTALPQDQLAAIKNQVTDLAAVTLRPASAQNHASAYAPPAQVHQPAPPVPASSVAPPQAAQGTLSLDTLLGPGALATLMARQSSQSSTPNPLTNPATKSPQPPIATPYAAPQSAVPEQKPGLSLLDQLRQAGILSSTPQANPSSAPGPSPATPTQMPAISASLASILAAQKAGGLSAPQPGSHRGLDTASLKQPARPDTISLLFERQGAPCTQCGRRFQTDAEGRKKKTAHMDWHFRVHQRANEAEKRGTHRSWYLDAQDWLKNREEIDTDNHSTSPSADAQATAAAAEAAKPKYIKAPDANSGINSVCPICQDRFENKWFDQAQDWVWLDAVLVGGRAYHASCHAEATRDREGSAPPPATGPAGVLGKRKAETGLASPKVRSLKTFG